MRTLAWLLAMGLVVFAAQLLSSFVVMLRARLRRLEITRVRFEDVPVYVLPLVAPDALVLVECGFELVSPIRIDSFLPGPPHWGYHLVHRGLDVHAFVRTPATPWYAGARTVVFSAFVADPTGPVLLTALDPDVLPDVRWEGPRFRVARSERTDPDGLLEALIAARTADGRPLALLDDDAVITASNDAWNEPFEGSAGARDWIPADEPERFRPTARCALRCALGARLPTAYRAYLVARMRESATKEPAWRPEEVASFLRCQPLLVGSVPRRVARTALFLGVLSSLGLVTLLAGWAFSVALMLVLALHEAGHAVAMRAAGYRDVRVYFVPLLGGATAGDGRGVSIHREALVLLAGPMPGLLLAAVGMALEVLVIRGEMHDLPPVLGWAIWLGLALNYFNLLPALPLDGGRLLHRIVSGYPFLETSVRTVSGLVLLGLGLWAQEPFTSVLGGWLLYGARRWHPVARIEADLRARRVDRLPTHERLDACFAALEGVRGWAVRMGLVHALDVRLAAPASSAAARAGWAVVYALCLILPVLAMANLPGPSSAEVSAPRDAERRLSD